jgi:lipoprotein-anchoring transpeptidase ErfK/SrfK
LSPTGRIDADTWRLLARDERPVVRTYEIKRSDEAGPFAPALGENLVELAALRQGPRYSGPIEELADRFHMSQDLLLALNPSADFRRAGTTLVVAAAGAKPLARGEVHRIIVSEERQELTALDRDGRILAVYPASVGSVLHPSPDGTRIVRDVVYHPSYVYDPAKLHFGPRSHGKLWIKPGPESPVGVVWIGLNAPSVGIHGGPDPKQIGEDFSHGCVRLTNWDAMALARGVRPGVRVTFLPRPPLQQASPQSEVGQLSDGMPVSQ